MVFSSGHAAAGKLDHAPSDGVGSDAIVGQHVVVTPGSARAHQVSQLSKFRAESPRHGSRIGPAHRFGTTLSDLFGHSWRRAPLSSWRWIPRLASIGEPGYIARKGEVRRLGFCARVVRRVLDPDPLSRTFAEVVRDGEMDRGHGRFSRRFEDSSRPIGGKRNVPEDWMEEDDLLQEDDLRERLRRVQEQKRRFHENPQGGALKTGMHPNPQGRGRSDPRVSGWDGDFRRDSSNREGGSRRDDSNRGGSRGGFGGKGVNISSDRIRSDPSWEDPMQVSKGVDQKKKLGEYRS